MKTAKILRFLILSYLGFSLLPVLANAAPTLKILSPTNGATLSAVQTLQVSVTSSSSIRQVVFYRDNWIAIGSVTSSPYQLSFDTRSLANGKHKFFAAAYTSSSSGASGIVTVNIQNGVSPSSTPTATPSPTVAPTVVPTVAPSPTATPVPTISPSPSQVAYPQAFKMADFILSLQDSGGAIKDGPGGTICNEDSNMEYAMLGLAAAYVKSKDARYLSGFEKALDWLAAREDMSTTQWRGSWYYTYSCSSPYAHVATSPGDGVTDVRGVDTTSAYFAYLLYIHQQITGTDTMVTKYSDNAKAALNFVLTNNWDSKGASYSSWQLINNTWQLWKYEYTADQADVYLGMRAGAILFDGSSNYYGAYADLMQQNIPKLFYDSRNARYAEGLDGGAYDWSNEFDAIFPQGYVPWVLGGATTANMGAYQWLSSRVTANGSIVAYSGDPGYSLSVSIFGMTATAVGQADPVASYNWLLNTTYDASNGAIHDTSSTKSDEYSNVAGFTILALLHQSPFSW